MRLHRLQGISYRLFPRVCRGCREPRPVFIGERPKKCREPCRETSGNLAGNLCVSFYMMKIHSHTYLFHPPLSPSVPPLMPGPLRGSRLAVLPGLVCDGGDWSAGRLVAALVQTLAHLAGFGRIGCFLGAPHSGRACCIVVNATPATLSVPSAAVPPKPMVTTVSVTEGRSCRCRCRCRCRLPPPSAAGWSWRPPTPRCQRYARHVVGAFGGRAAKADGHHGVGCRGPIHAGAAAAAAVFGHRRRRAGAGGHRHLDVNATPAT